MDTVTKSNPFILKWINEIFGTLYFNWPKNSIRSKSYPKPCLDSSSFQPYWVSAHQCGSRLYTMPKTHINNIGLKTGSCIHSNENDTITFIISLCITWFMAYPSFLTFLFFYGLGIIKELTFWALSLQSLKKWKIGSFGSPRGPIHIYNFVPKMGPRKYFQENGITLFFFFNERCYFINSSSLVLHDIGLCLPSVQTKFKIWCSLYYDCFYHQTRIPISFYCKWNSNLKSLIW